jgi:hypothetical protein
MHDKLCSKAGARSQQVLAGLSGWHAAWQITCTETFKGMVVENAPAVTVEALVLGHFTVQCNGVCGVHTRLRWNLKAMCRKGRRHWQS